MRDRGRLMPDQTDTPKLKIIPPDTEIKVNAVCRFKVDPPATLVQWAIQPALGTIDQNGVYTSPSDTDIDISIRETIKITATPKSGGEPATAFVYLADNPKCVKALGWYAVIVAGIIGILLLSMWASLHKGPAAPVVIVNPPAITLDPEANDGFTFSATILGDSNNAVTWSVEPPEAGTIDTSGNFHRKLGTTDIEKPVKITAHSVADPSCSGSALINLIAGKQLQLSPASMSAFPGQQVEFRLVPKPTPPANKAEDNKAKETAAPKPEDQKTKEAPVSSTWSVSRQDLATVSPDGVFTAGTPRETAVVMVSAWGPAAHEQASAAVVISVPFRPNPINNWPILLFVVTCGALGSMIYFTSSFVAYVGNRTFRSSWFWFYISRPFVGGGLAVIFFFLTEWGKISGATATNLATIGAISTLVGLFSDKAVKKLSDILDVLLATKDDRKDKITPDSKPQTQGQQSTQPAKPGPKITDITPKTAIAGSNINPQITGTNLAGATVTVNGQAVTPTDTTDKGFKLAIDGAQVVAPEVSITVTTSQGSDTRTITVT